jgi:hypothetical protein
MMIKKHKALILTSASIVFVFILWAASFYCLREHYPLIEQRGQFGDAFGAVNALFSGLAFALLIATIILQRADLKTQQELLLLQQNELKISVEAQQKSSQSLSEQKEIMRMQNSYDIVFNQIGQFNRFTDRLDALNAMRSLASHCSSAFAQIWIQLLEHQQVHELGHDINVLFVQNIYAKLPEIVEAHPSARLYRSYIQFAANVMYTIRQHKKYMGEGRKEAIFLCQLEVSEVVMLYLSTICIGMPICQGILWGSPATEDIVLTIKEHAPEGTEFSQLNRILLTTEFNKYRGLASYDED